MKTILFSLLICAYGITSVSAQEFNAIFTIKKSEIRIQKLLASDMKLISLITENLLPDSVHKTDSLVVIRFVKKQLSATMDKMSYAMYLDHVVKTREDAIAKEKRDKVAKDKALREDIQRSIDMMYRMQSIPHRSVSLNK